MDRHGHCVDGVRTPEYIAYCAAKRRCEKPSEPSYPRYGGRGIKFLFTSIEQFVNELGSRPDGKSLDRINNNGHYEPGNVRWATRSEQNTNRRPARAGALKPFCINGHPLTSLNDVYVSGNNRVCKKCSRRYWKTKEAA